MATLARFVETSDSVPVGFGDDALRAPPPEDDLGLVDLEARVVRSVQARCVANSAVDILDAPATATDEVMVIVTNPIFEARRRTCRLNPPNDPLVGEHVECIIDRLPRDHPYLGLDLSSHVICGGVRLSRHGTEDRNPLCGDLETVLTELFGSIIHDDSSIGLILDLVKYRTPWTLTLESIADKTALCEKSRTRGSLNSRCPNESAR